MMYYQGDWISIYVNSTVQFYPGSEIVVEVYDADGVPFAVHRIGAGQIVQVGGYYVAPYYASAVSPVIPSDAKVGLWSWRATCHIIGESSPRVTAGQIIVAPRSALLQNIMNMLYSINSRLDHLVDEDLYLVVALDEVDAYIAEGRSQRILYMLPRAYELEPKAAGRISLIYASRSLDWLKKLDEATLDTIGRTSAIHLNAYGFEQVRDIVAYRAELAFKPGALDEELVDFVAQISMPYGGVRYALELLLEAGMLADYEGLKNVKARHVRTAHASIPKGANGALCPEELSLHK